MNIANFPSGSPTLNFRRLADIMEVETKAFPRLNNSRMPQCQYLANDVQFQCFYGTLLSSTVTFVA